MEPAFAARPVPAALFYGTLIVWFLLEARQRRRRRPDATSMDRGSVVIVRVCAVAGIVLAALALNVRAAAFAYTPIVFGLGVGVMALGIALRWWCFRTLGRYFTFTVMTRADQPVIDTGPYHLLRHPSYAAMLVIFIGIGLCDHNWLSLAAVTTLPLIGLINRIRVEEAALEATLGAAYTTYATGRKRLIPFVW